MSRLVNLGLRKDLLILTEPNVVEINVSTQLPRYILKCSHFLENMHYLVALEVDYC